MRQLPFAAVVPLLLALACSPTRPTPARLTLNSSDSAGLRILVLSHSPHDVARGKVVAQQLRADLLLGGSQDGFGHLADVTTFPDGRILILDRSEKAIWLYDRDGGRIARYGREGRGPGEFSDPVALATVSNRLVIMQPDPVRSFTILTSQGDPVATAPPHQFGDADWHMAYMRGTLQALDYPYQMASEDWTRRLGSYDDTSFAYQFQLDERMAEMHGEPFALDHPPAYLTRFNLAGILLDTIAHLSAPASRVYMSGPNVQPQFDQPIFAARPVWAAGSGWFAIGHGEDNRVEILMFRDSSRSLLRWSQARAPLSDRDRSQAALWLKELAIRDRPDGEKLRQEWNVTSESGKRDWIEWHEEFWDFPIHPPSVTAMYGAGACLWLAGFASADYADGTALTWIVINVRDARVERVVRIPRRGSRVRHVDHAAIYASFRDENSLHYLERYRVTGLPCAPQ